MRVKEKNEILSLLSTIKEAIEYTEKNDNVCIEYMENSYDALNSVKKYLQCKIDKYNYNNIDNLIEKISLYIYEPNNVDKCVFLNECKIDIKNIIADIQLNIKVKIKVVFLPYKASMWTSLESIWKEANDDEECEATVVPIPYYELDKQGNKVKTCYEGDLYHKDICIKRFWDYDICDENPDMIFIHNPYDDTNTLTRVLEPYYSRNLKKYTDLLVYSPYYTVIAYNDKDSLCFLEGAKYADKIIVQSEKLKKIYELNGHSSEKILALGSPKMDAIYNDINNPPDLPKEWKEKIKNKKVFLLCTTLSYFIRFSDLAYKKILEVYESVTKESNCILIWRPHPLEEVSIKNNLPELLPIYKNLLSILKNDENVIIDKCSNYRPAFSVSEAMFCSYTSLTNEFMVTGKPVFILQGDDNTNFENFLVSYKENYYNNRYSIDKFIKLSLANKDILCKKRMSKLKEAFINMCDGSCGEKTYKILKKEILNTKN